MLSLKELQASMTRNDPHAIPTFTEFQSSFIARALAG